MADSGGGASGRAVVTLLTKIKGNNFSQFSVVAWNVAGQHEVLDDVVDAVDRAEWVL